MTTTTEVRFDKQGEMTDAERVGKAMGNFVKDFGRTAAIYMESCIHCGMCAEACHFYEVTKDPKYTPIWKLEPFKQAYKREYGPFALIYRALNLKSKVTARELEEWQHLLYDSCTVCGRCSLMCPMGIDIASLVSQARHGMFHAGLVPHELWAVTERGHREGSPLFGMPILDVEQAKNVVVLKRGQGRGFAGIENDLFYRDNTRMLYGDAQETVGKLVQALKKL